MKLRVVIVALLLGLSGLGLPAAAAQTPATPPPAGVPDVQPATAPADAQPATAPAETPSPQRTPRRLLAHFRGLLAAAATQPTTTAPEPGAVPGPLAEAVRCLDFAQVDPELAREHGPDMARDLSRVVEWLVDTGDLQPDELPDDPTAVTQVLGHDPLLLVLERGTDRVWRFSASTVADLPRLLESLHAAQTQAASQPQSVPGSEPSPPPAPAALASPRDALTNFLVALSAAADDPDRYADALASLNLSELTAEEVEEHGAEYAEQLGAIIQWLIDDGTLDLGALPGRTDVNYYVIGRDPLLLILTRDDAGRWQISARSVVQIPNMHAALTAPSPAPAVEVAAGTEAPAPSPSPAARDAERQAAAAAGVPLEFRAPRDTMVTFLRSMQEGDLRGAVRCLDLSGLTAAEREANAALLAGKLLLVISRHQVVVFQDIPDDPNHPGPYRHLLNRYGRIEIERQAGGERAGEWLFNAATVRSIERLYAGWQTRPVLAQYHDMVGQSLRALPSLWLRERIIPPALKRTAAGLQYWQWLGILVVLAAGVVVQYLAGIALPRLGRRVLRRRSDRLPTPRLDARAMRPFALLALVLTWWGGVQLLDLGARAVGVLWPAMRLVLVVAGAWALYRSIDLLTDYSAARVVRPEARLNDVLVPLIRKTLKVVVVAVGATMVLTVLGFQVGPLLAGLGLGGLAFSFAARDTIANFFGSVNVVLDRPFQVGDWVRINGQEGVIESVGLRSSRLRTPHDSELSIPNAELMTAAIDNLGRRRYRRTLATLAMSYAATPAQLDEFCEGVRELIRRHPFTRKDEFQVYVKELGPASIDILLSCFHETPDANTELRERHRLLLDILRLAERLGVPFAYPPHAGRTADVVGQGSDLSYCPDKGQGGASSYRPDKGQGGALS